ncbi:MAG: asparaginase [Candidatus Eisenbacteria bacterium]
MDRASLAIMPSRLDVQIRRGSAVESIHRVQAVVCDVAGRVLETTEHPELNTTWRSAAKPFQLLPLVERGHADRWGFTEAELAVMAASHTGSRAHIELVRSILARIGRDERDLACGYHDPLDPDSLAEMRAHPEGRGALYNNCSGKHAGMLALALAEGWPVAGYEHADHPLQRLMRRTVAEISGVREDQLQTGIDGCSVVVFALPLTGMATAYARLAAARATGDARERSLARIRDVMARHPYVVGGHGRFSSELMAACAGRLVSKVGAEGLECVAWTERGVGVAVKCEDGAPRATEPAVLAVLEGIGALGPAELGALESFRRPHITNAVGLEVGRIEAELRPPTGPV